MDPEGAQGQWTLLPLRLRPAGHAQPLPRMRNGRPTRSGQEGDGMKRWTFNILAALSLLLCLAVLIDRCSHVWSMNMCEFTSISNQTSDRLARGCSITTGSGVM